MIKIINSAFSQLFLVLVLAFSWSANAQEQASQKMSLDMLKGLIAAVSEVEEVGDNYMQFLHKNVRIILVADENADRMRLITPIVKVDKMEVQDFYIVMESNYHQALDARYATSNGILYSVFIHPLSPLDETQIMSALRQVATLAITYGSHYTSGELNFGQSFSQEDNTPSDSQEVKPGL